MKFKKIVIGGLIGLTILSQSSISALADTAYYEVKYGDTYWKISQRYGIGLNELLNANSAAENPQLYVGQTIKIPYDSNNMILYKVTYGDTYWKVSQRFGVDIYKLLQANNANENSQLIVGDVIIIPKASSNTAMTDNNLKVHIVKEGDTYWKISMQYGVNLKELMELNNANEYSQLYIGQKVLIPNTYSTSEVKGVNTNASVENNGEKPYVTYSEYTVQKGDTFWSIALKFGIPYYELLRVNNMNENSTLNIGDKLTVPVHHVPVKDTPGPQYGEYLDWWTEAQYVIPIGKVFKVKDFYSGREWTMKRTIGANHADCEPLTKYDSQIMKEVWGGNYSWVRRPVIILVDGRRIAASASSMPHDIEYINDNGVSGHMDIHFANSTRHKDGKVDYEHQENIKISAGLR